MAIRSQFYMWQPNVTTSYANNVRIRMFENLTMAAQTKATEFVVIQRIACTPAVDASMPAGSVALNDTTTMTAMYMQIMLGTTGYFVRPDGLESNGVAGIATPFPRLANYKRPVFELDPPVYVLPGQNWEVYLLPELSTGASIINGATADRSNVRAMIYYILYDNADSQFAVDLYKLGVSIVPKNVDEYKRLILERETGAKTA